MPDVSRDLHTAEEGSADATQQLQQAVLNIVRNAAQALSGTTADPRIRMVTRVARFSATLYLAVEPAEPFASLHRSLTALAPGNPPSGPVFAVVQGIVLVFFVLMIIGAWRRFRPV